VTGGNYDLLREVQGSIRMSSALGYRKIDHLNRIPFLAAKLREPGVKQICLDQYDEAPHEEHDSISNGLFDPLGDWWTHVQDISEDGDIPSSALRREVDSIANIGMDDALAESPHAVMNSFASRSSSAEFPWLASTSRLSQNLTDIDKLLPETGAHLETEWRRGSSLLQVSPTFQHRPKRMAKREVEKHIYFMSHLVDKDLPDFEGGVWGGDDGGNDGGVVGDEGCDGGNDGGIVGDAVCDGGNGGDDEETEEVEQEAANVDTSIDEVKMIRDFLAAALTIHSYISVEREVAIEGETRRHAFQLLQLESKDMVVPSYFDRIKSAGLYTVTVQPMEQWLAFAQDDDAEEMQCFVVQDPCDVDILEIIGHDSACRTRLKQWVIGESDVAGCVCLHSPTIITPQLALSSPKTPTLCLLDALGDRGWTSVLMNVAHSIDADQIYDGRKPMANKLYFKCVLALPDLVARGATTFCSNQVQIYYSLLMKSPSAELPSGLRAKEYKVLLDNVEGKAPALAVLDTIPPPIVVASMAALENGSGSDEAVGDEGCDGVGLPLALDDSVSILALVAGAKVDGPAAPVPVPVPVPGSSSSSSSSSSSHLGQSSGNFDPDRTPGPSSDEGVAGDEEPVVVGRPSSIQGVTVVHEKARDADGNIVSEGLRVRCPNPNHHHGLYRSLKLDLARFGQRAAEYYLGAWLLDAHASDDQRNHKKPNRASVQAFCETYGGDD
jgi:hypothetical protein